MEFRFDSNTISEEERIRKEINHIIEVSDNFPKRGKHSILLEGKTGMIIAMLIDIGLAPGMASLTDEIRIRIKFLGATNLTMTRELALDFSKFLKIGMLRHEAGFNSPDEVILH